MVKDNPKIGSFSQCDRCHKNAESGVLLWSRLYSDNVRYKCFYRLLTHRASYFYIELPRRFYWK